MTWIEKILQREASLDDGGLSIGGKLFGNAAFPVEDAKDKPPKRKNPPKHKKKRKRNVNQESL